MTLDDWYSGIWGDRWPGLKEALLSGNDSKASLDGLLSPYYMDRTSIDTARLLPVERDGNVLDMCAAPGGKTLVLALRLNGTGRLTANDRSPERRGRLRKTIEECLPEECRKNITVTGHDAGRWGLYEKEAYSSILLDAPCSSERHVLQSPSHLAQWSPSRPKRLQKEQFTMLSSAYLALEKGGWLLYSTCSVNPGENEENIARLLERHQDMEEAQADLPFSEKRRHGLLVLPDRAEGRGPMYACLLRKKE